MPRPVLAAVQEHLALEGMMGGYEAAAAAASGIDETYDLVGRLVGGAARNIAVVENATVAFAQAVTAFDFGPGDVIITTRNDYISNQILFLSLARRFGVEVRRAADLPEGGVDPDAIRDLARNPRCKLVAVTWVPTNSGLVQPVEAVGEVCAELDVPYLVDACQAVGQIPIDVTRLHCDFLSATARKFLRGPRGIGFLYVSDRALAAGRHPLFVDMRGARWTAPDTFQLEDDAKRFENWEFAYALVLGLGAAARYALEVGVETAGRRAAELAALARERLAEVPGARVLDRGRTRCAIVTAAFEGRDARDLRDALRAQKINTDASLREYAVIDMAEKGAETALRISPHYYNTVEELDALARGVSGER